MKKIFVVAPLCAFLTACGSDGGDSSTKTPTTLPTANTTTPATSATTTTSTTTDATTNTNASTSDTGTTGTGTANPTTGNGTATPTTGNGTTTGGDTGTTGTGTANPTTGNGTATTTTPPAEKVYGYRYRINPDSVKAFAIAQLGDGAVVDSFTVKVGDKSYLNPFEKDSINLSYLGKGFFVLPHTFVLNAHLGDTKLIQNIEARQALLQQQYSVADMTVSRSTLTKKNGDSDGITDTKESRYTAFNGLFTKQLPTQGTVTYAGEGYGTRLFGDYDDDKDLAVYDLSYTVDFDSKQGAGALINNSGVLALQSAPIQQDERGYYINKGEKEFGNSYYKLGFFSDNADEIAGRFDTDKEVGIMGGTKQAQ